MQKRFYLTPAAVIIFILYFTVFGDRGLLRINHLHRDRDEMQQHLQALKTENDRLKQEISALQSDRRYLESIARRDFGLVRSNEVIYQFPSQEKVAPAGDKAGQKVAQPASGKVVPPVGDQKLGQKR
jgi:cell division protein FtsB